MGRAFGFEGFGSERLNVARVPHEGADGEAAGVTSDGFGNADPPADPELARAAQRGRRLAYAASSEFAD